MTSELIEGTEESVPQLSRAQRVTECDRGDKGDEITVATSGDSIAPSDFVVRRGELEQDRAAVFVVDTAADHERQRIAALNQVSLRGLVGTE